MNREAIAEFQEAIRLRGVAPLTEALLGAVYVKAGERAWAEEILQKLKTGGSDVAPMNLAILQDALGNRDDAIAILEKAYVDRDENLPLTAVEPFFDSLRADPRLQELLRRMGLQP
jgi:Flp pilus assembly protein TadD